MLMACRLFGILVCLGFALQGCKGHGFQSSRVNLEYQQNSFSVQEPSRLQSDPSVSPDTCPYRLLTAEELERLKGEPWSVVKLVQNCRKEFRRTVILYPPGLDTFRMDIHYYYAGGTWLAADTVSPESDPLIITTYQPLGTWRHPRTGDLWAFLAKEVGEWATDNIEGVTSIHIIRPTERKVLEAIPVASVIFLSPDSTQLLLAGERRSWVSFANNSYCFGAIEVLDISEGEPRSLYRVDWNDTPERSKRESNKSIKAYRMEWREPARASDGGCPRSLWRYQIQDPGRWSTFIGSVEQVWSTPDGALLLRLSLEEESYEHEDRRTKELGVLYILI